MQKKTKIIIISTILLLITIPIIILLTKNANKQIPQPLTEQAKAQYETIIGDQTYDITNAVLEPENITPTISAGMIPVKWNGTNLEITTRKDTNWYDYANGKPAYIMLNDGYYKSEIEQGINENQLMQNNVGVGVPDDPSTRGTIYMWIPRFAYNAQGEILYIKQACSVAGTYTIPEIFTYQTEKRDFSLAGIWLECSPLANTSEVNTKISNMQGPNNKYGFIANTIGINANNEPSCKTTIETYNQYIANIVNGTTGASFPTDSTTDTNTVGAPLAGIPEGHDTAAPITITDISNTNRTILKITNSNQPEPIKGKAYYDETIEKIKIEVTYRTNAITKILNSRGTILSENLSIADSGDEIIGNKTYKFIVIDNLGNQKQIETTVTGLDVYIIENEYDLKLFRDAVNANKTTATTRAYQIADVKMNEGKYTINEETGDITFASDAEQWIPIGTANYIYKGVYYGNNHTISGMYINTTATYQGLFSKCTGTTINDLGIINSKITGGNNTGSIIGYISKVTLNNCYSYTMIDCNAQKIGGLVGGIDGSVSTIKDCYSKGKIIGNNQVGGIIGYGYKAIISNCYNISNVQGTGEVGGITGYICNGNKLDYCYNKGKIIGNGSVGGIVGCGSKANVSNCYNTGNVNGKSDVGGIIGSSTGKILNCYNIGNIISSANSIGGIVGHGCGEIRNCYNIGSLNGNYSVGGIIGYILTDITISNCYNATEDIVMIHATATYYGKGAICGRAYGTYSMSGLGYLKTNSNLNGIGYNDQSSNLNAGCSIYTSLESMPTVLSTVNGDNAFVEDLRRHKQRLPNTCVASRRII